MIVQLMGGVGNQLFQYAFGRSLSIAKSCPLFFDKGRDLGRSGYALDKYGIEVNIVANGSPTFWENGLSHHPEVNDAPPENFFMGYWQSEKYFNQEVIRRELSEPLFLSDETKFVADQIHSKNSVFIHIRRGDNLSPRALSFHGNLADTDYYDKAIEHIRERVADPTFFIFSDEPEWCVENYRPTPSIVVTHNDPVAGCAEDIWLMSQCDNAIIANSSFSWWGAWFQNDKGIVVAPKRWFISTEVENRDIVPERWVRM